MIYRLKRITPRQWLVIILILAFLPRAATALWLGDTMEVLDAGGTHDQVSYDMLAHRVATGHGFTFPVYWYPWVPPETPTSYYSGTMVLHLAAIYWVFGYHPLIARLLYAVLGTVIVYLVYRIARKLFGPAVGLVAGGTAAGYAYLILYSATLLTETPFILFLLLSINAAYGLTAGKDHLGRWIALGVALAGAVLFRMAVLPFVAVLLLWILFSTRRSDRAKRLWRLLIPIAIIGLAILPWSIRNYRLYGRFMALESQFGHVLWNSNHPDQGVSFRGAWVAPIPTELLGLNEADLTYELLRRGREFIFQDPGRFILLTLSRVKFFFTFWPTADSGLISNAARVLSFGILWPFMLYGLVLSRRQWRRCLPLYLFLVLHVGIYVVSWVMVRYRIPADTVLLIFAAAGIADLVGRATARLRLKAETN